MYNLKETQDSNGHDAIELLAIAKNVIADENQPNDIRAKAYLEQYRCLEKLNENDLDSLDKALELQPNMPEILMEKCLQLSGETHIDSDSFLEHLREINANSGSLMNYLYKIIETTPSYAQAYLLRAKIHQAFDNEFALQADIQKYISLEPYSYKGYSVMATYLYTKMFDEDFVNFPISIYNEVIYYMSKAFEYGEIIAYYWYYLDRFLVYYFRYINYNVDGDFEMAANDFTSFLMRIEEDRCIDCFAFYENIFPEMLDYDIFRLIPSEQWERIVNLVISKTDKKSEIYFIVNIFLAKVYQLFDNNKERAIGILAPLMDDLRKDNDYLVETPELLEYFLKDRDD